MDKSLKYGFVVLTNFAWTSGGINIYGFAVLDNLGSNGLIEYEHLQICNLKNMDRFKETIISLTNGSFKHSELVTFLELIVNDLEINTISEMARIETKNGNEITRNGIIQSPKYKKIEIGKAKLCVKGVKDDSLKVTD